MLPVWSKGSLRMLSSPRPTGSANLKRHKITPFAMINKGVENISWAITVLPWQPTSPAPPHPLHLSYCGHVPRYCYIQTLLEQRAAG
ncbi:hypothetical protein J6590_026537 [Homalodisca vitripennis]|nr:hypothetical protein J6590_026537 [Homalodisca vitripennis]